MFKLCSKEKKKTLLFRDRVRNEGVPSVAQWVNDLDYLCGGAGSISGLAKWVEDPFCHCFGLGCGFSSDLISGWGTSICWGWGLKCWRGREGGRGMFEKKKKKREFLIFGLLVPDILYDSLRCFEYQLWKYGNRWIYFEGCLLKPAVYNPSQI